MKKQPQNLNFYNDAQRSEAYAKLEFPATYYLAFRDLPKVFAQHVNGKSALDFGCGAGRSTRFLKQLGFQTTGIDISGSMVQNAKQLDPAGDYRIMEHGDFSGLAGCTYDLVLCAYPFDNIPTVQEKIDLLTELAELLRPEGRIVNLVSSPELYLHEWTSLSTKDFPENRIARSGDRVRIVITASEDRRPYDDILCTDADYRSIYASAGLSVVEVYQPLGTADDPFDWLNETQIPPWTIYVLKINL